MLRYLSSFGLALADGEEVIQEAFLWLFQRLHRGKSRENLRGWLFRVAHNLALERRYRSRREFEARAEAGAGDLAIDPGPGPEAQVVNSETQQRLPAVVEALPKQCRRCLFLAGRRLALSRDRRDSRYVFRRGIPFFGPISGAHRARRRTVRLMSYRDSHLSDQRLLLDVEGELSTHDEKPVQSHLDACWKCRARRQEIENAIADFIRIHQREFDVKLPPAAGRRALLKAELARLSAITPRFGWRAARCTR